MSAQRRTAMVVAVTLGVLACLLALVALAAVSVGPGIPSSDVWLSARLHEMASPRLDQLMSTITDLGSTGALILVSALAAGTLAWRDRRTEALFVVLALVATLLLNGALKVVVARPRPELDWAAIESGFSFPSGHSMNSFVVYVAVAVVGWVLWGRRAGILALLLALLLAMAIGVSRVYLGVHWPTDVMAGFVAGILCLFLVGSLVAGGRWLVHPSTAKDESLPD